MTETTEVLYLAKNQMTGCWEQRSAHRSDGHVDIRHATRTCSGFSDEPEQLFAAGWTASSDGTMARAAVKVKVILSDNSAIDATVDLYVVDGAYVLQARLDASLSDMPPELAGMLGEIAHVRGADSKAFRGALDLTIDMV